MPGSTGALVRRGKAGVLALSFALAVAACGSDDEGDAGSDVVTLRVQTVQGNTAEAMEAAVPEFEKTHPGIKVKIEAISNEAKVGPNLTVLTSSDPPDVGFVPFTVPVYSKMIESDLLVPLDDLWEQDDLTSRYGEDVASVLTTNDHHYVVNLCQYYYNIVFYNKDMFAEAGIEAPADHIIPTMDDLVAMTDALKKAGYQGLGIGPTDGFQSSWLVDAFLPTVATPEEYLNLYANFKPEVPVSEKYTDGPFEQALDAVKELGDRGVFQDGYLGQDVATAEAGFVQGKLGMMLRSIDAPSRYKEMGMKFDLGWMLLPPIDPSKPTKITSFFGSTLVIPKGADHVEEAKEYLSFLMDDKTQLDYVTNIAHLPPAVNTVDMTKANFDPLEVELLDYIASVGQVPGWTSVVSGDVGAALVEPLIQRMWTGQESPADVATATQKALDEVRAKS